MEFTDKKICTLEDLKNGETVYGNIYFVYIDDMYTRDYSVGSVTGGINHFDKQIENCIYFTKEEYAEDYIKELKKFNKRYKEDNNKKD